ncbi:MAG: amino acid transporter [archaeon]|nr:amino acid transporter [archaeon]
MDSQIEQSQDSQQGLASGEDPNQTIGNPIPEGNISPEPQSNFIPYQSQTIDNTPTVEEINTSNQTPENITPSTDNTVPQNPLESGLINNAPVGHSSFLMGMIQICNTIVGDGIISLPVVTRYLGLPLGLIFMLFVAAWTVYTVHLLLTCQTLTKKKKYTTIARKSLGNIGFLIVAISIIINNFGLCCIFFRIFGETFQNIVQGFVSEDNYFVTNWHNYFYVIIALFLMCFVIFTETFETFEKTSLFGIVGILVYCVGIYVLYFYKLSNNLEIPKLKGASFYPSDSFAETLACLPSVFIAFTFHMNFYHVYFSLRERSTETMTKACLYSIIFCCFLNLSSSICSFLMYGDLLNDTALSVLRQDMLLYKDKDNFIKANLIITNIGFVCCSTTGIPLMFYSLKKNLFDTINHYKNQNAKPNEEIELTSIDKNQPKEENKEEKKEEEKSETDINTSTDSTKKEEPKVKVKVKMDRTSELIISVILYVLIGAVTIIIPQLKMVRI